MKTSCSFPPLVVSLLVFALSSQSGVAIAAMQSGESQDKTAPTGKTPTAPVVEEGVPPPSPAPAPAAGEGATPASEANDGSDGTSAGASTAPPVVPRVRKANDRSHERVGSDGPSDADAYTPEHGHLGLVLGVAKAFAVDGSQFGYGLGLRGGYRLTPLAEIGLLVAGLGQFGGLTVDTSPILFQFNGILPVNPKLSFSVGGQLGLVHYRMGTSTDGVVGMDAFAFGPQVGVVVRLSSRLSLRFELSLLHATRATTTVTSPNSTAGYVTVSNSTDTYSIDATTLLQTQGAFCIGF